MQITIKDMGMGTQTTVTVSAGATVAQALAEGNFPTEGCRVRVDGNDASTSSVLNPGDSISYTRTDIKGADDEELPTEGIRQIMFDDIANAGSSSPVIGDSIMERVLAKSKIESSKKLEDVVAALIVDLRAHTLRVNTTLAEAQARVKRAEEDKARAEYAIKQLSAKNNIFAAYSLMGRKNDAKDTCAKLGCAVPSASDVCWHTSEDDAKK